MKKLLLFFTTITLGLSLTSCLDGGSQNFSETAIVYIDQHSIQTYGKALNGRGLIISQKIQLMEPKNFYIFSYSWNEESEYTAIGDASAYNVNVISEEIKLQKTWLSPTPAPAETPTVKFKEIAEPIRDEEGKYIDDNWLFPYSYMGKEGETPSASFFKREGNSEKPNLVEIDIRLTKTGEGKGDERQLTNYVGVDLNHLRQNYITQGGSNEIEIKFYYYVDGKDEPVASEKTYKMKKPSNSGN